MNITTRDAYAHSPTTYWSVDFLAKRLQDFDDIVRTLNEPVQQDALPFILDIIDRLSTDSLSTHCAQYAPMHQIWIRALAEGGYSLLTVAD